MIIGRSVDDEVAVASGLTVGVQRTQRTVRRNEGSGGRALDLRLGERERLAHVATPHDIGNEPDDRRREKGLYIELVAPFHLYDPGSNSNPARARTLWEPLSRLTTHPLRSSAASTSRARVLGLWLMRP